MILFDLPQLESGNTLNSDSKVGWALTRDFNKLAVAGVIWRCLNRNRFAEVALPCVLTVFKTIEFCTLDSARLYRQFASWKLLQNWNLSLAKEFCHATSMDVNERLLRRRCGYKRCF
jgi:hypothetical protein